MFAISISQEMQFHNHRSDLTFGWYEKYCILFPYRRQLCSKKSLIYHDFCVLNLFNELVVGF